MQTRAPTHLDFVRVPPVLLEDSLDCHVARQDHHFVAILSAHQLTLLTWVSLCVKQERKKNKSRGML